MSSYEFVEEIGRGGMGRVYKGRDSSGRIVAIKMMSNKVTCYPEYRALFQSEVESLRQMNHPAVVKIVGEPYGDSAGNLFLPMEFIRGKTIEQSVHENGPMTTEQAVSYMLKILDAMTYIHRHKVVDRNGHVRYSGCIHRDIKPSNIMIRDDGSVCIIDFGIAKDSAIGSSGKTVGRVIGTDGYMSPEQATGLNIDTRTDIYSLGCVFYYMLTGYPAIPNQENEYKTVQAILSTPMPLPSHKAPNISKKIDSVFLKAVDKNMTLRYQTAEDFKQALLEGETDLSVPTVRVGRGQTNDIVIDSHFDCVSTNHLVVKGLVENHTGSKYYYLLLEDRSRNGSGVDGKKLHHETQKIEYTETALLPQVMLAGRYDCILDWNRVIAHLKEQGWNPSKREEISSPAPPIIIKDKLGVGYAILCLLFPIVGWVLYGVWRRERPRKAAWAARWAWIGFFINLMCNIFIL